MRPKCTLWGCLEAIGALDDQYFYFSKRLQLDPLNPMFLDCLLVIENWFRLELLHDSRNLQTLLLQLIFQDFLCFSSSRNSLPPHRNWLLQWQAPAPGCRDGDSLPCYQGCPVPHREPSESWSERNQFGVYLHFNSILYFTTKSCIKFQ